MAETYIERQRREAIAKIDATDASINAAYAAMNGLACPPPGIPANLAHLARCQECRKKAWSDAEKEGR